MKLKSTLYILLAIPFLWSCDNEDDVDKILVSGTWYVFDFWDSDVGDFKYISMVKDSDKEVSLEGESSLETIRKFTIAFKIGGSFSGTMEYGSFSGTWEAKGSGDRPITLTFTSITTSSSALDQEYLERLQTVKYYRGDSESYLHLVSSDKKNYIQFKHDNTD